MVRVTSIPVAFLLFFPVVRKLPLSGTPQGQETSAAERLGSSKDAELLIIYADDVIS
jgi:hypothetical protein